MSKKLSLHKIEKLLKTKGVKLVSGICVGEELRFLECRTTVHYKTFYIKIPDFCTISNFEEIDCTQLYPSRDDDDLDEAYISQLGVRFPIIAISSNDICHYSPNTSKHK